MKITWVSPYLDLILERIPTSSRSILEVGCGSGIFGFILKQTRSFARVEGVEPFEYLLKHYDFIWRMEWVKFIKCEKENKSKYDVLVCNETIEHMEKKSALKFLDEAKKITDKVIVGTPYKWDQQEPYDNNPYQVHQCVITISDLTESGYDVLLFGFFNFHGFSARIHSTLKWKRILELFGVNITNLIGVWQR